MNGENINNGGENLNANEAFKRDVGGVAVENFDLMTQEELDKTAEEAEKTRKALLEQWMKINETTKKIEQEKARREEYNRQKEHAINGTIMDITAWVNTHPNELKEFVHPKLQGGIEKAQKEFEETGTFFNILYASRELTARLAEAEAAAKAVEEILAGYANEDVAPVEAESAEQGVANEDSGSEEIVDTTDVEDTDSNEPKPFDVNYPVFNGLDDENLSYPIVDDEKDAEDDDEKNEDDLSYPAEDESERDDENGEDNEDDTNEAVDESKNKDEVLDEYVQEVVAQILAGGARELELQRNKQKQATSSENVSAAVDEVIDNKAEQEKNEKVEKIKKKFGLKHGFKKLLMKSQLIKTAVAAAVAVLVTLSIAGDANAVDETRFSKVATEESAGGEDSSTTPDVDSTGVKYGSKEYEEMTGKPMTRVMDTSESGIKYGSKEYEEMTGKPMTRSAEISNNAENVETKYDTTFNFVKADGETGEYTLDFFQKYRENALDLFDVDVMEKGGEQTSNNKESKLAFGPILDSTELEGGKDVLNYLSRKGERMAGDALYMMYANSWNGALDASDGYDINVEHVSVDGINSSARKFESASLEEKQAILDKIMEDEAEAIEGRTMQYATFPAGKTYITAHMEKGEDGIKKIAVAKSSKPTEFNVLQRLNENGENEFDQGETKLRILKAHGLADADMTLEQAEQRGLMKRYTVWGERNKCGGQMVITENYAKKKAPKPEKDQVVTTTTVTQEIIPVAPVTPGNPTPNNPTPNNPTPSNPTPDNPTPTPTPPPELEGKTMTNPWADNNPTQMPVTVSFEQESADNGGAPIVQAGQEQVPEVDTSGVNEAPAAQQDWAEEASAPVEDTGTGGTEDQSASSDAEAAAMLSAAESGSEG